MHPDGDDLAACLISFPPAQYKFNFISVDTFITEDTIKNAKIGPGDDVFVVGRFINHEGRQRNLPTARFGFISQMPYEPILTDGFLQDSFLVEAKSLGGYSGSPVFWRVLPFHGGPYRPSTNVQIGPLLLGVEWGYLLSWSPLCDERGEPVNPRNPHERQVKQNSGMMAVVPAWKLAKLLNGGELLRKREEIQKKILKEAELLVVAKSSVAGELSASGGNPRHKKDFTSLLNAAAKPLKLNDETS